MMKAENVKRSLKLFATHLCLAIKAATRPSARDDMVSCIQLLKGGIHPDYFVEIDFEIAVDQQTRARDRTFEGVPDSG